ncbi:RING/U-box [Glarea lozoyensis ATCC 20868]|uniref:RING/U-box n=1 Tax=Glarea lozoyensis (strain ATCC 20868 / MF5171) TaxID=1116229 RepID=S3CXN4_GLAL2|nr:RING/U-box [Glarea lozoyensis ATCC 20868]EPE29694.1 RING/U-box [Glarea lozoyensis ATCC 20868]
MASHAPTRELRERCLSTFNVPYHRFTIQKLSKVLDHSGQDYPKRSTKETLYDILEEYSRNNDITKDMEMIGRFGRALMVGWRGIGPISKYYKNTDNLADYADDKINDVDEFGLDRIDDDAESFTGLDSDETDLDSTHDNSSSTSVSSDPEVEVGDSDPNSNSNNELIKAPNAEEIVEGNQQEQRGLKRRRVTKHCVVCLEDCDVDTFPEDKLTNSCSHEIDVCIMCVSTHIDTQVKDNPTRVACPTCLETLGFEAVRLYASAEAFERYDHHTLLQSFKDDPLFTMCLGPNCSSGQFHSGGYEEPIMTCTTCHFKTCFVHRLPWHPEQTCAEFDAHQNGSAERLEQEAASERYAVPIRVLLALSSVVHGNKKSWEQQT